MDDAGTSGGIGAPIVDWKPGEWHAGHHDLEREQLRPVHRWAARQRAKDDAGRVGLPADSTLVIGSNFARPGRSLPA